MIEKPRVLLEEIRNAEIILYRSALEINRIYSLIYLDEIFEDREFLRRKFDELTELYSKINVKIL